MAYERVELNTVKLDKHNEYEVTVSTKYFDNIKEAIEAYRNEVQHNSDKSFGFELNSDFSDRSGEPMTAQSWKNNGDIYFGNSNIVTGPDGNYIDFDSARNLMDDDICNDLNEELAPCSSQKFFDRYCTEHYCKYHEEFEPIKQGGQW